MGVNGTGAAASNVSVNFFHGSRRAFAVHSRPWQLRGRQRGPSRGDASPHFPGDAAGEKALSPCASMGFWGCGSEEGVFFVRFRPGSGLSPLRARAGAALVFFWADAQQGKGRGFLERKPPKELLRSLRSASLQLQLLSGVFPRFRQGAQGGQVLLIPVGVLQHPLLIQLDPQQPLALL